MFWPIFEISIENKSKKQKSNGKSSLDDSWLFVQFFQLISSSDSNTRKTEIKTSNLNENLLSMYNVSRNREQHEQR